MPIKILNQLQKIRKKKAKSPNNQLSLKDSRNLSRKKSEEIVANYGKAQQKVDA